MASYPAPRPPKSSTSPSPSPSWSPPPPSPSPEHADILASASTSHPVSHPNLTLSSCPSSPAAPGSDISISIRHAAEETVAAASSLDSTLDHPIVDRNLASSPSPRPSPIASPSAAPSTTSLFSFGASPSSSARVSRRDRHLPSTFWPLGFETLGRIIAGAIRCPVLPPFSINMASTRRKSGIPSTPRVISPSPSASDYDLQEYSGPVTRSVRKRMATPQPLGENVQEEDSYAGSRLRRSRTRSRSPTKSQQVPRMTTRRPSDTAKTLVPILEPPTAPEHTSPNGKSVANGHLAPPQSPWNWRDFSRSPSPLGLIPIHRHWRSFVHKHEVPRKVLHVSIGFFVTWLYTSGTQTAAVAPYLMAALIPIAATDWLRHRYASFNSFYVKVLGALMRESEYSGWNGVVFYLLGAWLVLYFLPKDVAVMSILLLSWCDTAASTFGRLWGRYTPRIRRGKSLAGSLAALLVGVATSVFFYGWLVPTFGPMPGDEKFMFKGVLTLPRALTDAVGLASQPAIAGPLALGVMSLWSGFVASASEVADVFGWDDNLTIPVLSGVGIGGFLYLFG
ncbi:hypothetical protein B0I35DRAFT_478345 [Stachybotrys elegans]|uniref:Phosphatidate cytidylyltransferase n=1 Tax=Stachybotrys elegans TaxID=80388 RepID=A0A8K0SUB6_9HYPO|nr:hypothetical protein B0I35DRAFT_478345 [Stachybotrys elegans]